MPIFERPNLALMAAALNPNQGIHKFGGLVGNELRDQIWQAIENELRLYATPMDSRRVEESDIYPEEELNDLERSTLTLHKLRELFESKDRSENLATVDPLLSTGIRQGSLLKRTVQAIFSITGVTTHLESIFSIANFVFEGRENMDIVSVFNDLVIKLHFKDIPPIEWRAEIVRLYSSLTRSSENSEEQ